MPGPLSRHEVSARAPEGWRVVRHQLETTYSCPSYTAAGELAARLAELADELNHHPEILIRYPGTVRVATTSHDVGGLTERDLKLAERADLVAGQAGSTGSAGGVQLTEIAIDALDIPVVKAFWQAVLAYVGIPDDLDSLADPTGVQPTLWFQQMDEPRPERNRIHLDTWVPHDVVQDRIATAVAAGGRVVSDTEAPRFWVLADPEGNEACLCTWQE